MTTRHRATYLHVCSIVLVCLLLPQWNAVQPLVVLGQSSSSSTAPNNPALVINNTNAIDSSTAANAPLIWQWNNQNYGPCSSSCGLGLQFSIPRCLNTLTGVEGNGTLCVLPPPAIASQQCSGSSCNFPWRNDRKCGIGFPAPDGTAISQCNPSSLYYCCSHDNNCGSSPSECSCPDCIDYRMYKNGTLDTSSNTDPGASFSSSALSSGNMLLAIIFSVLVFVLCMLLILLKLHRLMKRRKAYLQRSGTALVDDKEGEITREDRARGIQVRPMRAFGPSVTEAMNEAGAGQQNASAPHAARVSRSSVAPYPLTGRTESPSLSGYQGTRSSPLVPKLRLENGKNASPVSSVSNSNVSRSGNGNMLLSSPQGGGGSTIATVSPPSALPPSAAAMASASSSLLHPSSATAADVQPTPRSTAFPAVSPREIDFSECVEEGVESDVEMGAFHSGQQQPQARKLSVQQEVTEEDEQQDDRQESSSNNSSNNSSSSSGHSPIHQRTPERRVVNLATYSPSGRRMLQVASPAASHSAAATAPLAVRMHIGGDSDASSSSNNHVVSQTPKKLAPLQPLQLIDRSQQLNFGARAAALNSPLSAPLDPISPTRTMSLLQRSSPLRTSGPLTPPRVRGPLHHPRAGNALAPRSPPSAEPRSLDDAHSSSHSAPPPCSRPSFTHAHSGPASASSFAEEDSEPNLPPTAGLSPAAQVALAIPSPLASLTGPGSNLASYSSNSSSSNHRQNNICTICLSAPSDAFAIPCGHHSFCMADLTRWAATKKECPVCRCKIEGVGKLELRDSKGGNGSNSESVENSQVHDDSTSSSVAISAFNASPTIATLPTNLK